MNQNEAASAAATHTTAARLSDRRTTERIMPITDDAIREPTPSGAPRSPAAARTARGFSLLEMLIVVAIIGLLAALVVPNLGRAFGSSQEKTAKAGAQQLLNAVEEFRLDAGRLPTEEEGLRVLIVRPDGLQSWDGPYLQRTSVPPDPWGNAFVYRRFTSGDEYPFDYTVLSLGADGAPGGEGDAADIDARDP